MPLKIKRKVEDKSASFKTKYVCIDTETTGLNPWLGCRPFAVGIINDDLENPSIKYYEWPVDPVTRQVKPDPADLKDIRKITEDESLVKVFHNAKFDIHMLNMIGVEVKGRVEDTSFAARICNTMEMSYGLKPLARRHFSYPEDDLKDLKNAIKRMRLKAKKLGWTLSEDGMEADYWLCQQVDKLLPDLTKAEREEIRNAVGVYCAGDVFRTSLLWSKYSQELDEDECYRKTYESELELLMGPVLAMERRGMAISRSRTEKELDHSRSTADKHLGRIQQMAEEKGMKDFNPGSPKQLASILFSKEEEGGFGLEAIKQSASGQDSTDWKALRPHASHPFVREILHYRAADKAISTFFQKYLDMMTPDPITRYNASVLRWDSAAKGLLQNDIQVIHPSLNQCGTVTGRFSCSDPNLQQVANSNTSAKGTDPIQARAPFGPRPGYNWYLCDYASMELRVFADIANVPSMLEAIFAGRDLNTENANRIWGGKNNPYALEAASYSLELGHEEPSKQEILDVWEEIGWDPDKAHRYGAKSTVAFQTADDWLSRHDYDIVKAEKSIGKSPTRARSKIVMFCKIYGGGPAAVVDLLYCTMPEAKAYWKALSRAFPEADDYIRSATERGAKDGYIINKYGRKLRVESDKAYRAVNYMVQGTCADLMKDGIRRCYKFLQDTGIDGHEVMTIHDELIFEIRQAHAYRWILRELCRIMSDHEGRLRVPMPVEMKRARSQWDRKETVNL